MLPPLSERLSDTHPHLRVYELIHAMEGDTLLDGPGRSMYSGWAHMPELEDRALFVALSLFLDPFRQKELNGTPRV